MENKWDYGGAFMRHPMDRGTAVFADGSRLRTHNIFDPLPGFMRDADLLFVDPPWNQGNMTAFYTKAGMPPPDESFPAFYQRLFECISEIHPTSCYVEVGKDHLADFIIQMRAIYGHTTFYNSSYYHCPENHCYVVRGSRRAGKPKLDGIDEADIIERICRNEEYSCIGDLCMGRGLVAVNAFKSGRKFVGTELNPKRLSAAVESLCQLGGRYQFEP